MPPNRMNLSWCVRRSIRRNTVLDSPRVVSKSSILRWTPFNMPRWSRRFDSMFEPLCSSSSMPWFADWSLVLCCNAASIVIDVSSFGANIRDISSSRSRSSSSFWYLYITQMKNVQWTSLKILKVHVPLEQKFSMQDITKVEKCGNPSSSTSHVFIKVCKLFEKYNFVNFLL